MKVVYFLDSEQLGNVEATLTITMPIKHWKDLCSLIEDKWPGWDVKRAIRECVGAAEHTFRSTTKED